MHADSFHERMVGMTHSAPGKSRRSHEARRAQIIVVATRMFLSRGYDATSVTDIVDEVGGSRRDIYAMFSDKEGLFDAVLQSLVQEIIAPIEMPGTLEPSADIARDLHALGVKIMQRMLDPSAVAILRQFVAIGDQRPDLGRQAFLSGPGKLYRGLEAYFGACVRAGRLVIDDVPSTARMFVEMLKGEYQVRALMTGTTGIDDAAIAAHVEKAVALLLNGTRPRAGKRR